MDHIYDNRKKTKSASPKPAGKQPSLEALRTGAAAPSSEQKGHRVDLPDAIREKMETAFGADLSSVKLYESETVRDAGAEAVAQGSDIAFAPGMLDFTSYGGQARLGHELSHVVSQARGEVTGSGLLYDPALEARADREGGMAAAGQQISVPTEAMSPVTSSEASGPMQCIGKKKKPVEGPAPNGITLDQYQELKPGSGNSTSVAKVDAVGGGSAVLKMGTNVAWEKTLSQFHNLAGSTYSSLNQGDTNGWSFNAPDVRGLTDSEKRKMRLWGMIGTKDGKFHSLSTQKTSNAEERNGASVYSWADGKSRVERGSREARDPGAISSNPADPMEQQNYRKMLGFVAMTDMATGNFDRLVGQANLGNWTEDRNRRQVHLIDNDYTDQGGVSSDVRRGGDRSTWLSSVKQFLGGGANEADVGKTFMTNMTATYSGNMFAQELQNIFGAGNAAAVGANQALQSLPQMRAQLEAQYKQKSPNGELDQYQKELLERMQIMEEYSSDKQMAQMYGQLADLGYTGSKNEAKSVSDQRSNLLQAIQARRKALSRQS